MRIDTTKIEGYSEMTAEEKLSALESFEYNDFSSEVNSLKGSLTRANADAAEWKRKHNALLTEEELRKAEEKEEMEKIREENERLKTEKALAIHKSSYISLGYDEALATATAQAIIAGDMEKVFANQKVFQEKRDRDLEAQFLARTPVPPPGNPGKIETTKEDLRKMSPQERLHFAQENPEEYKEIYGGSN